MARAIQIDFQTNDGNVLAGELVNPYNIVESPTSPCGLGLSIDQIRDGEFDVLVYDGAEMHLHRIGFDNVVGAEEVLV